MADHDSHVTIHMAASLDNFIARKDGRVDWLETSDEFAGGEAMDPQFVEAFLRTIDCYVMGSRTYETALSFEAKGLGWSYGDTPTFVLTSRVLPRTRNTVEFHSGDLAQFVNGRLRPAFRTIWFVGGSAVSAECLRLGLADEVRYSILPILIGDGIPFFEKLDRDVPLHLAEVKAYKTGMVALRYEVRRKILVSYDYGSGGLWAYVVAPSVESVQELIQRTHPERAWQYRVWDSPPTFWNRGQEELTKTYSSLEELSSTWPGLAPDYGP